MAGPVLIDLQGVAKEYEAANGSIRALDATTLAIDAGQFVSIVGPSGCGKTTLLKMIGGLIPATGGAIRIAGQAVQGPRDDVGFVFQNAVLLPWKTALENILLPIRVRRRPTADFSAANNAGTRWISSRIARSGRSPTKPAGSASAAARNTSSSKLK